MTRGPGRAVIARAVPDSRVVLAALTEVLQRRTDLDRAEYEAITNARDAGVTWEQIARHVGYKDRRGAQMRYRMLSGRAAAGSPEPPGPPGRIVLPRATR